MTPVLRRATLADAILFYALRSDPETRRFLPNPSERQTFNEHLDWFIGRIAGAGCYVAEITAGVDGLDAPTPVGVIRVEWIGGEPWVSIIVAADHRGRGLGTAMLDALIWKPINARIHRLNVPSLRAFERSGYRLIGEDGAFLIYRRGDASATNVVVPCGV